MISAGCTVSGPATAGQAQSLRRRSIVTLLSKICGLRGAERPSACLSWEASVPGCGRSQRKLCHRQFSSQAVETHNVSYLQPVGFGWRATEPSNRLGDRLWAVHPATQFLSSVFMYNPHLVLATVLVRHAFSPESYVPLSLLTGSDRHLLCRGLMVRHEPPHFTQR
jgi:hypothetical protein